MREKFFTLLAQIKKSDLTEIDKLPSKFDSSNIKNGLAVVFGIAGGVALIIIAYGGLKFVLSQGNPQEITKAKNTIIDGLIGLAVIVAAGGIVGFVMAGLT